ncbi:radical SAM/SPASM domain-containing protein [Candidatus Omnitrophota bacterium]
MLKLSKYILHKKTSSPIYLIHFVTSLCNARCPHCFISGDSYANDTSNELTIAEIEKVTKAFSRDLVNVNLTGGEPFIRDDLPQIVDLYVRNAGIRSFLIATNGFFLDKILENLNEILLKNKDVKLTISLSLDHIGERHDQIRGVSGLYVRVIALYRKLILLNPKRLLVQINLTLQRDNYKDIENIFNHLVFREKIKNLSVTLTRGKTSQKDAALIDVDAYFKLSKLLDDNLKQGNINGFQSWYYAILNAKNQISRRVIGKIIRQNRFISPCYAGSLLGVLYPNGDVYPCELYKEEIGNVREFDYNFSSLWNSKRAKDIRRDVAVNKCFCTHECSWTTNILFNPRYFPELAIKLINLESRKIVRRFLNG